MITFIIPSISRDTLINSIQSIQNQTNENWKLIVIFDGVKSTLDFQDDKIKVFEIEKTGEGTNNAGNVRNYGMQYVDTEWIAFLDDDDTISNDYIQHFIDEQTLFPSMDVLIFRMLNYHCILPSNYTDDFYINSVGISFCMKKKIFDEGNLFVPSNKEDFNMLDKIRSNHYHMNISPYLTYFVRSNPIDDHKNIVGNRVCINY